MERALDDRGRHLAAGCRTRRLPVNDWTPGVSHRLAVTPPHISYALAPGADPRQEKDRLVRSFVGEHGRRREALIAALSEWVAALLR